MHGWTNDEWVNEMKWMGWVKEWNEMKPFEMKWIVMKWQGPTEELARTDDENAMKNKWKDKAMEINGMSKQALHGVAKKPKKESLTWAAF